jgi:hypothetical protein
MTACASEPRIYYVHEAPDTPAFPVFPPPDAVIYDEETDTVSMPLWFWQKITEYKISVDAICDYLTILHDRADVEKRSSNGKGMEALARKTREKLEKAKK